MGDSTNNYVIRLAVDNTAANKGFTETGTAGAALGASLAQSIGAGAQTAAAAIQVVDRESQKFAKTVQDTAATLGLTKGETIAYRAEVLGLGEVLSAPIAKILEFEAAQRGVASSSVQAAAAVNAFGETEEQASARIRGVAAAAMESQAAMQASTRATYDAAIANQNYSKSSSDSSTTVAQQNKAISDYAILQSRQNAQAQELREGLKTGSGNYGDLEAQYGRLDAAMAQGALTTEEYESAFASLRKEEDNLARGLDSLRARYDPIGVAQRRLAQDTKALDDAFKNGQLSEKEYEAALAGIKVDQAKLALASLAAQERDLRQQLRDGTITNKEFKQSLNDIGSAKEPLQAVVKGASSAGEAVHEFGLKTAAARREVIVLGHEALTGNWSNFNGSLMVLAERADLMTLAMSATGLAIAGVAAVIGVFAVAAVKGALEQEAMNRALVMSGNYAGTTADGLLNIAKSAATSSGAIGTAKAAVMELAGTGRFTASQIAMISAAVTDVSDTTGRKVSDTVAEFERLAEDPVKSIVTLNDKYHFLTEAVYDQITALDKQGDRQGAAQLAEQTYATALSQRAAEIRANQGIIEEGWHAIKSAASEAWAVMLSVGTTTSTTQQIAALQTRKQSASTGGEDGVAGMFNPDQAVANSRWTDADESKLRDLIKKQAEDLAAASKKSEDAQTEAGKISAKSWMDGFDKQFATQAQKRQTEKDEYAARATALGYSPAKQAADMALIDAKYKDPKTPHAKAPHDDAGTRMLEASRQTGASLEAQLASSDKLTEAAKKLAEFDQRIADIKTKQIQTADDKSILASQDANRAQLQNNVALEKAVLLKQQEAQLTQRSAQINQSIADGQATRAENYQRTLGAFGQGKDVQAQTQAMNQIATEFQRYHEQLAKATPKDLLGSDDYVAEQAKIDAAMQRSLGIATDYYAQLKEKQGDWTNGVSQAMADYQSTVANHAAQAETIFNDSMKSGEDIFANFAKTGKLSVTSLADTFIEEIARMEYRLLMSKLMSGGIAGAAGSGSWLGNLLGTSSIPTGAISAANGSDDPIGALATIMPGWDDGGFTGAGGKYAPAGIVHKGEFVFDQQKTARYRPLFEAIHAGRDIKSWRGYAEGGYVGGGKSGGFGISVPVNVVNEAGDVSHATAQQSTGANGIPSVDVLISKLDNAMAKRIRSGQGATHSAISSRFGVKPKPGGG
jgi:lambda family phage tail tape measure protein